MSQQYLLPCDCGRKCRVDAAQAGGTVACDCGKSLYVPTLRGLKQLEPAPFEKALDRSVPARNWSPLRGALFSLGLLVAVVAAAVGAFTLLQHSIVAKFTVDRTAAYVEHDARQIDRLPAADSLDLFRHWQAEGLGEQVAPDWVQAQRVADMLRRRMILCGVAVVAGLGAALGSVWLRPAIKS
jgi:hypothetical protein